MYNTELCYVLFQMKMNYEIIGDYPGPDFFAIELESGMVYVKRDLREDSLQLGAYTVSI